jgi:hypothetical protein
VRRSPVAARIVTDDHPQAEEMQMDHSSRHAHRPGPPFPEDASTATRHLCAGAYLDESFRNESLRQVYYQPRRLVAPSYGFDLVPVLAHCLRARNGALLRDGAIVVTLLAAACASWVAVLSVLFTMGGLQAALATYRLSRDLIRDLRAGTPIRLGTLIPRILLLVLGWLLVFALGTVASGALVSRGAQSFGQGGTSGLGSAATGLASGSIVLGLLVFAFPVAFSLWRQSRLLQLTPGSPLSQPVRTARLDEVAGQQRGNTVVYSGFRPYVGSGVLVETWGFAQRLVRPQPSLERDGLAALDAVASERQREFAAPPFEAQELVDHVREHMMSLLPHRDAGEQIAGLTVQDQICLAGTEVTYLAPYTTPEVMAAVIRHPSSPARHYLACQVFAWGGQLITTVYVHLAVQGRSLYLELTTTALPPCVEAYRVVDTVEGTGGMAWLRALLSGLADTPRSIWRAPANLLGTLINMLVASGTPAGMVRGYDYGARIGVRELGSDEDMRNLVQYQDVEKYQKLIERRVIASVLDFLDDRDIDTTEYRARAASVLNNSGVINTGNDVTYQGSVAGGNVTDQAGRS